MYEQSTLQDIPPNLVADREANAVNQCTKLLRTVG